MSRSSGNEVCSKVKPAAGAEVRVGVLVSVLGVSFSCPLCLPYIPYCTDPAERFEKDGVVEVISDTVVLLRSGA